MAAWGEGKWISDAQDAGPHEAHWLTLSWEKAAVRLDWHPVYALPEVLANTVEWYREWRRQGEGADMYAFSTDQLRTFTADAHNLQIRWACPQPSDRIQRKLVQQLESP